MTRKPPTKLSRQSILRSAILTSAFFASYAITASADDVATSDHPLPSAARRALDSELDRTIAESTKSLAKNPKDLRALSQRGDALFFRGRFTEALGDYDAMAAVDPDIAPTHWRRGLAAYYAGKFEDAARQFQTCFRQDDSDRENGIWRYFALLRLEGKPAARGKLLKYTKDDRPPLPAIYQLIAGEKTAAQLVELIPAGAGAGDDRAAAQAFYIHLYVGITAALDGDRATAEKHLREAVSSRWAQHAGYGPNYMWRIALLEYDCDPGKAGPLRRRRQRR